MRWTIALAASTLVACGGGDASSAKATSGAACGSCPVATAEGGAMTVPDAQSSSDAGLALADAVFADDGSSSSPQTEASSDSAAGASALADGGPSGTWVVAYYSGFGSNLPVTDIEWSGLSHLAVAFYLPDAQGNIDESISRGSAGPALARSLVAAAHAAGKKILASLGGSNSQSMWQGATSAANRAAFEAHVGALVSTYGFDGIDLDWEPFDSGDHAPLLALAQDLRAMLPTTLVTMPVGCENNNAPDDLSFFASLAPSIDRLNLMSYGLSGAWQGWKSWHSSPLHWNADTATPIAIDSSVDDYAKAGVPLAKLGIGSGFFGECYTSPVTAPDQALGGASVAAGDGTMSYANILGAYYSSTARKWDGTAMVPYLTFAAPQGQQGCTYVTYEDEQSIAAKGAYTKSRGLGGVIIWTINEGYVASAPAGKRNPLLDAMKTAFLQ